MKGAVSAKKALEVFETEMRAGRNGREKYIYRRWEVIGLPSRQVNVLLQKGNRKNGVGDLT